VIEIDRDAGTLSIDGRAMPLDDPEAIDVLHDLWLDVGIRTNHPHTFTWLGRPVIQFPEDLVRLQELVHRTRPDVVVETGVAHGGSLVFHASLLRLLGGGRVIGIDVEIRAHNRAAIQSHPLADAISLVEGSSTDLAVVAAVHEAIRPGERVLVVLDSDHRRDHVLAELEAYAPLVSPGSYLVALDGHVMEAAARAPRATADWATDNPNSAVAAYAAAHPEFVREDPPFQFNESPRSVPRTGFTGGVLRRIG
jgi:cephalosporin hydroxylase